MRSGTITQTIVDEPNVTITSTTTQQEYAEREIARINADNNGSDGASINPNVNTTTSSESTSTLVNVPPAQATPHSDNRIVEILQGHQATSEGLNQHSRQARRAAAYHTNTNPNGNRSVHEVLNDVQENADRVVQGQQHVQVELVRLDTAFGNLRRASTILVNDYLAFIAQHPFTGLITSAVTLGGVYMIFRYGGRGLLNLVRGTAHNIPLALPQPTLPVLPVQQGPFLPNMQNIAQGGGILYIVRVFFRFLRHL